MVALPDLTHVSSPCRLPGWDHAGRSREGSTSPRTMRGKHSLPRPVCLSSFSRASHPAGLWLKRAQGLETKRLNPALPFAACVSHCTSLSLNFPHRKWEVLSLSLAVTHRARSKTHRARHGRCSQRQCPCLWFPGGQLLVEPPSHPAACFSPSSSAQPLTPSCRRQQKWAFLLQPWPGLHAQHGTPPLSSFLHFLLLTSKAQLGGPQGRPYHSSLCWPLPAHSFSVMFNQWLTVFSKEFGCRSAGGLKDCAR